MMSRLTKNNEQQSQRLMDNNHQSQRRAVRTSLGLQINTPLDKKRSSLFAWN